MYNSGDAVDGSKIFIWAQIGELLKQMDSKRLLTIGEKNPNYSLSVMANDELMNIVSAMKSGANIDETMINVTVINERDNLFREIVKFLHHEPLDLLSVGSSMIGELPSKIAFLDMSKGEQ